MTHRDGAVPGRKAQFEELARWACMNGRRREKHRELTQRGQGLTRAKLAEKAGRAPMLRKR